MLELFRKVGIYMDRSFRGFIAGVVAGLVLNAFNLICYYPLHLVKIRFIDWSSIIVISGRPETLLEITESLFHQLMWDGALGTIFAHLIPQVTSRGYLLNGAFYGYILAFIFRSIVELYRVPFLTDGKVPSMTTILNTIGVLLWGLVLAAVLKKFDKTAAKT